MLEVVHDIPHRRIIDDVRDFMPVTVLHVRAPFPDGGRLGDSQATVHPYERNVYVRYSTMSWTALERITVRFRLID